MSDWINLAKQVKDSDRNDRTARLFAKENGIPKSDVLELWESQRIMKRRVFLGGSVAAITTAAAAYFFPGIVRKGHRTISFDDIKSLEGIENVYKRNGKDIDVIYIGQAHSTQNELNADSLNIASPAIDQICRQLYSKYAVKSLLLEGIDMNEILTYSNSKGVILVPHNKSYAGRTESESMSGLLNAYKWDLYPGENSKLNEELARIEQPITNIRKHLSFEFGRIDDRIDNLVSSHKSISAQVEESIRKEVNDLTAAAQREIDAYLTPEFLAATYAIKMTARNKIIGSMAEKCKRENKGPLIVVYGISHCELLLKELESRNLGYIALIPKGFNKIPNLNPTIEDGKRGYKLPITIVNFK